jgi:hypothetical protein
MPPPGRQGLGGIYHISPTQAHLETKHKKSSQAQRLFYILASQHAWGLREFTFSYWSLGGGGREREREREIYIRNTRERKNLTWLSCYHRFHSHAWIPPHGIRARILTHCHIDTSISDRQEPGSGTAHSSFRTQCVPICLYPLLLCIGTVGIACICCYLSFIQNRYGRYTVDPRVTTGLIYEQLGLRPKF